MRKVLVNYGKQQIAKEADFSQFLVVLNFPIAFQYTHMLVFFYADALEIK